MSISLFVVRLVIIWHLYGNFTNIGLGDTNDDEPFQNLEYQDKRYKRIGSNSRK